MSTEQTPSDDQLETTQKPEIIGRLIAQNREIGTVQRDTQGKMQMVMDPNLEDVALTQLLNDELKMLNRVTQIVNNPLPHLGRNHFPEMADSKFYYHSGEFNEKDIRHIQHAISLYTAQNVSMEIVDQSTKPTPVENS